MADAASLSAQQISEAVRGSVQKALQGRNAVFTQAAHTVGPVPRPPHWIGIIYNNPQSQIPADEAQKIADSLAEASGSGAKGGVCYGPDYVTIGFRLPGAPPEAMVE
jgi:hypothetical protein